MNWVFTDTDQSYAVTLRNAALTYHASTTAASPDATITLTKATLDRITLGETAFDEAIGDGLISIDGDSTALTDLLDTLDTFQLMFNIVER